MCGRFTLTTDPKAIQQAFDLDNISGELQPRYNIAPSQPVAVITNQNPKELTVVKWGLVPSWSKDPAIGNKMINARSETAAEKPSFRSAFKRRRCLIPADGFFEWTKQGKKKVPMYIHLEDNPVFAFAGLWEVWQSPDGSELQTCTILTTEPNDLIRPLHHRMAVILDPDAYDTWLSPDELPADVLMPLMTSYPQERMRVYEVSTQVNSPANDNPSVLEPFDSPRQQSLF
jgi:putative SOS response-associated peptidase YedK